MDFLLPVLYCHFVHIKTQDSDSVCNTIVMSKLYLGGGGGGGSTKSGTDRFGQEPITVPINSRI